MSTSSVKLDVTVVLWLFKVITFAASAYALVQGTLIIVGGAERWSAPSFAVALSVKGAPASWGVVLLLAGFLVGAGLLVGRPRVTAFSLMAMGVWNFCFAISIVATALSNPLASTTGAPTYAFFTVVTCIMGVAYLHPRT